MFAIDKNIPMPKSNDRKYPLDQMEVGDSFLVTDKFSAGNVCTRAKKLGIKVTVRKVEGGHRVWRIR